MDEEILRQREAQEALEHQEQVPVQAEQLQTLQSWGGAQGEQLQQKKQSFNENVLEFKNIYDEDVIRRMGAQAQRVQVSSAAPVDQPLTEQPVAKESYKARRERQKKIKAAKKVCPVGDENTLEIFSDLKSTVAWRYAVFDDNTSELLRQSNVDSRALKSFFNGYNLDKNGRPVSEDDRAAQEENRRFARDYMSGDPLLRRPHLDRIKTQILRWSFDMKPDMFTPENLVRRAAEYKVMGDRFTYIENVQKENPEYFAQLPQLERELLEAQTTAGFFFVNAYSMHMNALGIDFNNCEIYGHNRITAINVGLEMRDDATESFSENLKTFNDTARNSFLAEVNRLMAARPTHIEDYPGQTEHLTRTYGVSFPNGGSEILYESAAKYRDMIRNNPEAYQRDREVIDKIFADYLNSLSGRSDLYVYQRHMSNIVSDHEIPNSTDPIMKGIARQAGILLDESANQNTLLERYGQTLADVMHHLLTGSPLGDVAAPVLQRFRASTSEEE